MNCVNSKQCFFKKKEHPSENFFISIFLNKELNFWKKIFCHSKNSKFLNAYYVLKIASKALETLSGQ